MWLQSSDSATRIRWCVIGDIQVREREATRSALVEIQNLARKLAIQTSEKQLQFPANVDRK